MEPTYPYALQVEVERPRPGLLLRNVHTLYHSRFRRWFAITAPTSVLAALVLLVANERIYAIQGGRPLDLIHPDYVRMAEIMLVRFGCYFLVWFLGCFALAAIAGEMNGVRTDDDTAWVHDSHHSAREHFGSIFKLAPLRSIQLCRLNPGTRNCSLYRQLAWRGNTAGAERKHGAHFC